MIPTASLRQDHDTLKELLAARRAVSMETAPVGVRMLWSIYLTVLEDAVKTLHALLDFQEKRA